MKLLAAICLITLGVSGVAAQTAVPASPTRMSPADPNKRPVEMYTPTESDVYCAGFVTDKPPIKGLFVVAGEEGGLKQLYTERDTVFLSRGAGFIVNPGGEYILLREIVDPAYRSELFLGQNKMLKSMGTVYAEVGRLR